MKKKTRSAPNNQGPVAMCQKMLDENQTIIDGLRAKNAELVAEIIRLKSERATATAALEKKLQAYKAVVKELIAEIEYYKK